MERVIQKKLNQIHNQFLLKKMQIQFFADGGDGGGTDGGGTDGGGTDNENPPKTYSEEEYLKLKSSLDKALKEVSEAKKREREKMTDDEKKDEEQKAISQKLAEYESKFEDYELKEELMKANIFSSEEIDKIVGKKSVTKDMLNEMVKLFNVKIEDAKKEAVQKYMQSSDVNGSGGSGKDKQDPDVLDFIESRKKNSASKAKEYYLGK